MSDILPSVLPDVLMLIGQQEAKEHPKWALRNNLGAEEKIANLLSTWRVHGWPILHVSHGSTFPDSPFRPGQGGNDFSPLMAPLPAEDVHQLTLALLSGDYATVTSVEEVLQ